jgi:hypothetical protein
MVVYAVWDRVARVRFPAPRQIEIAQSSRLGFFNFRKGIEAVASYLFE